MIGKIIYILLALFVMLGLPIIIIVKKIIKKHKEKVIFENEYQKAKKEQNENKKEK